MTIDKQDGFFGATTLFLAAGCIWGAGNAAIAQDDQRLVLEEIIVTAQKREISLQELPIAISVLDAVQLEALGISGLDRLADGVIPSLRVQPNGNTPATLSFAIRGNGPTDNGQITRESSVAVYQDGFYLSRAQGLSMELTEMERIEILRGPQGTLFGRNATGGAINMISKKPTGAFGVHQTISYGRFDELRSVTRLNLPEFSGIRAKVEYLHAERDGWVDNTAPGEQDFNAYNKDAARISLNWRPTEKLKLDYSFNFADTSVSFFYLQLAEDNIGLIGVESGKQRQTRFPVTPLDPATTEHRMHTLTAAWNISDNLTLKSLSSYREMEEELNNNYAGVLYFNGLVVTKKINQEQWSEELQLVGTSDRFDWVAGLYYFEEDAQDVSQDLFSLDIFGFITGTPLTSIEPPTNFNIFSGGPVPLRTITANAKSLAFYGHATWTPPVLDDRLHIGVGLRYTNDDRSGSRTDSSTAFFNLETDHVDPSISVSYDWSENISTYAKWSTGYKAGGVSPRSTSFQPYLEEKAETFEIGFKSEFWNRRGRFNVALFATDYDGLQIDFTDPANVIVVETINAANTVEIDGLEVELTVVPLPGLVLGLSYTYLDSNFPLQPNPLAGGAMEQFSLVQTPKHAGSVTVDYSFEPWSFGTLAAHLDISSTSEYSYVAFGARSQRLDAYTLINARLTLANIRLGGNAGSMKASLWARNLTDAEYVIFGFPVGDPPVSVTQAFGTPRTFGFDVIYEF